MQFSEALSLISQAITETFGWFYELINDSYWIAIITVFGIYTASRLLLMPLIGRAGSDAARRTIRGK